MPEKGATDEWGNKEVLGLIDGFRESTQSWRELLLDLKRRGLEVAPKLAVGPSRRLLHNHLPGNGWRDGILGRTA